MSELLLFSENDKLALELAPKAVEMAHSLGMEASALVLGQQCQSRAAEYFAAGIEKAYINEADFPVFDSRVYAQAVFQATEQSQPSVIMCVSTKKGRIIAPRLAKMLNSSCSTNVLDIQMQDGQLITSRYGLGGATIITERLKPARPVIAILPQRFEVASLNVSKGQIIPIELKLDKTDIILVERGERNREVVEIEKANRIVCAGRGLRSKEDLGLIRQLADVLGAEIGCTRELSSNLGWLTEDHLVGMSGKRCKPNLVFSIGISGQNQYIAGITGAKVSVAINNAPDAPIFKACDYGMVEDLYKVLPALIEKLKPNK